MKTHTLTPPSSSPSVSPLGSVMPSRCLCTPALPNLGSPCPSLMVLMVPKRPQNGGGEEGGFQALTKSYKRTSASFPFHRVITYLSLCADQQGFKRKSCMRKIGVVGKDILVSFEKRRFVYKQDNKVLCSCSPSRWVMAVNTIRFHLSASTGGAFGYHVSAAPRQFITILPVFLLFPYLTLGPLAYSVENQWLLPRASLYYHLPSS